MKKRFLAALVVLALILIPIIVLQMKKAAQQENVQQSEACSYDVILPEGYETGSVRYPVVYVLPEDGYAADSFAEKLQEAMRLDSSMDMIIVKPELKADMSIHSVMEQMVAEVDGKYRTIPDSRYRAAAGVGVGGYLAYIAALTDREKTDTVKVLAAPKLFSIVASVRGNFTDDGNPWYAAYGDVLVYLNEIGSENIENWYTYVDAPTRDTYTSDKGSTNDIGKLFIGWNTGKDSHEFTVRSGDYTDSFVEESAKRILNRMTGKMLSGLAKGKVALEKSTLTDDEENVNVSYTVNLTDLMGAFTSNTIDMKADISIVEPDTGEVLAQAFENHSVEQSGEYAGKAVLENLVNGTSSKVQLSIEIFGTKLELANAFLFRQDTVIDGDYQKIDLNGNWYFNYTGADRNLDAKTLTVQGCKDEHWSVVQPGLGNWSDGYGNISEDTVGESPDSPYFNYMITGNGYYVREIEVPEEFNTKDVILSVGYVDDRCEVFLNGERVGATGMDERGNPTSETTWAVYSKFEINPNLLKRGQNNIIVVRAWNDLPYGGGGWYGGPIALCSRTAFEEKDDKDPSRFFEEEFESALIKGNEKYLVYLPESYYETDRYYPTVYLLHQFNSDHTSYKTDKIDRIMDESVKAGLFDEMIVIAPNSSEQSWWTGKWEKMVTEELIPLIDSKYRTIKDARFRMTAGCSMGGQGAFGVALTNPDQFSGAVSFFGALSMPPTDAENALKIAQDESEDYLNYYAMYFICGNQDSYGFGSPAIDLDRILTQRGVEHEFFIENGEHNSALYVPYVDDAFAYMRNHMYQSDGAIDGLLSGKVTVDTQEGIKVEARFEALDGIDSYYNTIPASSYTQNPNPDFSIPLIFEVIQDGKVVFSSVEDSHSVNMGRTCETFKYDISGYVNAEKEYSILYKAAVFDRVVELDRVVMD